MTQVDSVVFDVGRVLIDFSYEEFFALLNRRGGRIDSEVDFSVRVGLLEYEHGRVSDQSFLAGVNALLTQPLPAAELEAAWTGIFTPCPEMLDFAARLKEHCRVYLLSNTSPGHWAHLKETYRLGSLCHDLFASCEVGVMKPAGGIFAVAEQRFGLKPATTLFVDDKAENIAGAAARGWHGLQHRSPQITIAGVRAQTGFDD